MEDIKKAKKNLKTVGIIICIFALAQIIYSIVSVLTSADVFMSVFSASGFGNAEGVYNVVLTVAIVIAVIQFLLFLFIGLKGIIMANGGRRSGAAVVLSWIGIILNLVAVIFDFYSIFAGTTSPASAATWITLAELLILIAFVVFVRKVYIDR